MKKIAFISDIHSNFPALMAVAKEITRQGISEVYCLGDIIGYHTMPNEVVEYLKNSNYKCIKGNHDKDVVDKKFKSSGLDIFKWTYNSLSSQNYEWLSSLPELLVIDIGTFKILLCHGSPNSITEYMYEDSDTAENIVKKSPYDLIACAHTHIPYFKIIESKYLLNSGSVGKPKIGRPNATFVILTEKNDNFDIEIVELPYEYSEIYESTKNNGFFKFAEALKTGIAG